MAKPSGRSSVRRAAGRTRRGAEAWAPESGFRWGLADGLGLTALVVLALAWPGTGDPSAVTVLMLTVGALACLPFAVRRWRGSLRGLALLPLGAAGALLAWGVVSAIGSGNPWQVSVYGWFGRADGLLTLLAVASLLLAAASLSKDEIDRLVTWLLAAGALVVLEAMGQLLGATYPPRSSYSGISAALGNPNFFAATTAILGVLALGRAMSSSRPTWQRWAAGGLFLGLAASTLLSESVQGPVALAIGVVGAGVAWSLQHRGKGRSIGWGLSAAAIIAGLVGLMLIVLQVGPFAAVRQAETIGYRQAYWEAAWRMMTGLPLFGSGPDGFSRQVAAFRTESYLAAPGSTIRVSAAHDIPLQYGATMGVIGLLAWLALMVGTGIVLVRGLLRGVDQIWVSVSIAGAWIAYLAQAMISIDAPGLKALGWLVTGLAIAVGLQRSATPGKPPVWMPWVAGALGLLSVLAWLPAITATTSAVGQTSVQGASQDVVNPLVPCPLRQQTLTSLAQALPPAELAPIAQAALDADPRCAAMAPLVGEILLQTGDVEGARRAAEIAVETDPLAPTSWFILSLVLEAQDDQTGADEARAEAERLAAIDPSDNLDQALATDPPAQPASP